MDFYITVYTNLIRQKDQAFDLWYDEVMTAQKLTRCGHFNSASCAIARAKTAESRYRILYKALDKALETAENTSVSS